MLRNICYILFEKVYCFIIIFWIREGFSSFKGLRAGGAICDEFGVIKVKSVILCSVCQGIGAF